MAARYALSGTSRYKLTAIFVVVLLPPAVTLIWLGLRLLEQDRILQTQREIESREASAEAITRSLTQSIAEAERWSAGASLPDGALRITISSSGLVGSPHGRLLWSQSHQSLPEATAEPFLNGEKAEFQGALESALHSYQEMARSSDPSLRSAALLRVARVERNQGKIEESLKHYRSLAAIQGIAIDGTPTDLLARRAICSLLESIGRNDELHLQTQSLETDFLAGRWTLDRPTFELVASDIERWMGHPLRISSHQIAFSAAADWLGQMLRDSNHSPSGRRVLFLEGTSMTLIWRTETAQLDAIVIGPTILGTWIQKALQSGPIKTDRVSLLDDAGNLIVGDKPDPSSRMAKRTSIETGLPWTLVLSSIDASRQAADFSGRRRLLASGLAAIVLLLAGGSYFLWRVMSRELAIARLQADFVAAVSHEFRTPLTSLRHVTELLQEDDGFPPGPEQERRRVFYTALGRNTERLHRLVESLLDFSRMETGKRLWNLESMDAGVFAADVAAEFQKEVESRGIRIDFAAEPSGPFRLRADASALGHALWNLLDNAVKYSPETRPVHVSVGRHPRGIAISVRDEGIGIPASERHDIFRKFVRGSMASDLGINGTGLGLALVSHIVEAHGGAIELESEEGKGSTFRLVLPAHA